MHKTTDDIPGSWVPTAADNDRPGGTVEAVGVSEATRRGIRELFAACEADNVEAVAALLADQVVLQPPASEGADPVVGREAVARRLTDVHANRYLRPETVRRVVHRVVVDGDTAVVLGGIRAKTPVGLEYRNEYVTVCRVRDRLVDRIQIHADTLTAARFGMLPFYWL